MKDRLKTLRAAAARLGAQLERVDSRWVHWSISLVVTGAALVVFYFGFVQRTDLPTLSFLRNIELRSLDARFTLRGSRPHDDRIVVVGIDEKTLQKMGAWPVPRDAYAKLIDRLKAGGARVVAFDVTFPTPEKNSAVEALKQLEQEVGGEVSPQVLERIREIERESDNDRILAESMRHAGNVVLGHIFLDRERSKAMDAEAAEAYFNILWGKPFTYMKPIEGADLNTAWENAGGQVGYGIESNIVLLAEAAAHYGYFSFVPDPDGTMRRAHLLTRYQDLEWYPILGLAALQVYNDIPAEELVGYMAPNGLDWMQFGPYQWQPNRDGSILINYVGPYHSYQHYSMGDVADGSVPAEVFRDKIVLVGATALGIGDLRNTPFPYVEAEVQHPDGTVEPKLQDAAYMGVEIHANVIDNLLHFREREPGLLGFWRGPLRQSFNERVADVLFILTFGLALGAVFTRAKPFHGTLWALLALALFGLAIYYSFAYWGVWLNFVVPTATVLTNYAGHTSVRMIFEEREKRKIRKSFQQYVSPGVISLIEKDPKKYFRPGGEMKELTIMFSDIRSFTSISEGLTPDELVLLLNEYLGEMTDILFRHWGTLDKYIGDAIMGFWGSPYPQEDHAQRACASVLEMGRRLDEMNHKWEAQGKKQLQIGIGLNTGPVNVGNMGSSKRLAWTVMGDNVNVASRLEGQTKDYHVRIIIGQGTYETVKDQFVCRELDLIRVKGKEKPLAIYELLAHGKDAPAYAGLLASFADALATYRRQQWNEAIEKFEAILSRYPDDGPSHTFLKRSHERLHQEPVPDWDGVYVAKTK